MKKKSVVLLDEVINGTRFTFMAPESFDKMKLAVVLEKGKDILKGESAIAKSEVLMAIIGLCWREPQAKLPAFDRDSDGDYSLKTIREYGAHTLCLLEDKLDSLDIDMEEFFNKLVMAISKLMDNEGG